MNCLFIAPSSSQNQAKRLTLGLFLLSTVLIFPLVEGERAQTPPSVQVDAITISGTVRNSAADPVKDASVVLSEHGQPRLLEAITDETGQFSFSIRQEGTYTVTVEKSGFRKCVTDPLPVSAGQQKKLELLLVATTSASFSAATTSGTTIMEFDDKPNFTVAGVTDWSGAGGHGSDTSLRTSEAFARETLALKSSGPVGPPPISSSISTTPEAIETERKLRAALAAAPNSFEAQHQLGELYLRSGRVREAIPLLQAAYQIKSGDTGNSYELAQAYRATGELDEQLGNPLSAVREYERATTLDPSEQNYFAWGSELLLHRAVSPANAVFRKGSIVHPNSSRMLVGLGAALYAAGSYDDAARELCRASTLNPEDFTPYLFLGKMEVTVPTSFPCAEERLSAFLNIQPENALANYYFAISLARRARESKNSADSHQAQALLEKSVAIDPKLGEAYLQLGVLFSAQGDTDRAITAFTNAIAATPSLSEAHYRLSQLYKHNGEKAKADREIQLYKQVEKTEAEKIEQQRREVQQFLIVLQDQPARASPH